MTLFWQTCAKSLVNKVLPRAGPADSWNSLSSKDKWAVALMAKIEEAAKERVAVKPVKEPENPNWRQQGQERKDKMWSVIHLGVRAMRADTPDSRAGWHASSWKNQEQIIRTGIKPGERQGSRKGDEEVAFCGKAVAKKLSYAGQSA